MTRKQGRFVEEYLVDLCATQAAIRAGYKAKTAAQAASNLLRRPDIQEAVRKAVEGHGKAQSEVADRKRYWEDPPPGEAGSPTPSFHQLPRENSGVSLRFVFNTSRNAGEITAELSRLCKNLAKPFKSLAIGRA